ncbi:MAG: hypothetical protein M3Q51_04405 [Pseudomonadota bacterium]|nr:hypothetical protein [Pseudomonadota bacterium]MDQ3160251.1 hypothetical protein [Pseudomonadota bacterium]
MRLLLFALFCLSLMSSAHAQRPPAVLPQSANTVVEVLPRGYPALTRAAAGLPNSRPLEEPARLLRAAARTGDARLAARADALLARAPSTGASVELRKLQAFGAQHRHAFATSRKLLDGVINDAPRDADARLARAQLNLVQGRVAQARKDCVALAVMDAGDALICIAALSTRKGEYAKAAPLVERFVSSGNQNPDFLRFALVMRGEIATRAGEPNADVWYQRALALDPQDVRTLAAYARHLNGTKQPQQTLDLLANAPEADGLQLLRALAARAAGRPEAAQLADGQARRYALARSVGMEPELRDEAELLLTLRGDAPAALALALRNFESQRDYEDVDLLQRAAAAAKRPDALAGLAAWARREGITLPARGDGP